MSTMDQLDCDWSPTIGTLDTNRFELANGAIMVSFGSKIRGKTSDPDSKILVVTNHFDRQNHGAIVIGSAYFSQHMLTKGKLARKFTALIFQTRQTRISKGTTRALPGMHL